MINYDCVSFSSSIVNVPYVIILSVSICISSLLVWISINTFKTYTIIELFRGWFKHTLFMTEHEKGLAAQKCSVIPDFFQITAPASVRIPGIPDIHFCLKLLLCRWPLKPNRWHPTICCQIAKIGVVLDLLQASVCPNTIWFFVSWHLGNQTVSRKRPNTAVISQLGLYNQKFTKDSKTLTLCAKIT